MDAATLTRFMAKVQNNPLNSCWEWTGYRKDGYGHFMLDRRVQSTHRLAYEHWVGAIPQHFHIDHLCRNRACCNPAHLEAVTQTENNHRSVHPRRTHCKHGHAFTTDNTRFDHRNVQLCMECGRTRAREYARRMRQQANELYRSINSSQ